MPWRNRVVLVAVASTACFNEAPTIETNGSTSAATTTGTTATATGSTGVTSVDSSESASSASSTVAEETGQPACDPVDEVALPDTVPEGWTGWSVVSVAAEGEPAESCPGDLSMVLAFSGAGDGPQCSCSCENPQAVCAPTFSVFVDCNEIPLAMMIPLQGCTDRPRPVAGIDVAVNPLEMSCNASPSPLPGPGAQPISICSQDGGTCMPIAPGFVGPCIVGTADCPQGYDEHTPAAQELSCDECPPCTTADFCDAQRFDMFAGVGCMGRPTGMASADVGCVPADFQSVRMRDPAPGMPTGCTSVAAIPQENRRICCLE